VIKIKYKLILTYKNITSLCGKYQNIALTLKQFAFNVINFYSSALKLCTFLFSVVGRCWLTMYVWVSMWQICFY